MAEEVELKLELTPEDAESIERSVLLKGDPARIQQRSIYFDTSNHSLSKSGLSLRIRCWGDKKVQTVKANGASAGGLFARSEWERPVPDDTPILDDTTPIRTLLGKAAIQVAPVFEVCIERRTWMLHEGDTSIELALDRGEVIAGDRRSPVCEIELELKDGDASALFAFARKLDAIAPVRLGVLAKAERGYRLIGPVAPAAKAEPIPLNREMTAAEAFQHIVQGCVRQFRLNEALLLDTREATTLHQARVALRRLRSAFSIFKNMLGDDTGTHLRDELRWFALQLGDARNLDVLLQRCKPGPLQDRLATARDAAYARVEAVLASPRTRALLLDLAQWTVTGDWLQVADTKSARERPAQEFAGDALDHWRRKVKKDGRALAKANDRARHEVRKDAKKLRYAAEFFHALFDRRQERRRYKHFIAALDKLQDHLGALNDLAIAPEILAPLNRGDDPEAATLLTDGEKTALLEAAEDAHDDLVDAKRFWR